MRLKVIRLTGRLLYARRNGNLAKEQKAYESLRKFCNDNNLDFNNAFIGARKVIANSLAGKMNGLT